MRYVLLYRIISIAGLFALAVLMANAADEIPAEITSFASGEWVVESFKYGQLGNEKKNDAAILIAIKPQHAFGDAQDRKLIVAMRGADGKLHKIAQGANAVALGAGPAGADPEISIERRSVMVSQFGGSREKGTDRYQYKDFGGVWRLIGFSSRWYDSLAEGPPESTTDVNFLTNYVEASYKVGKKCTTTAFYEIPSIVGVPPAKTEWKAPYLVLSRKAELRQGMQSWKGEKDLSAKVQSMHDSNKLYVLATVKDDSVTNADSVALLDARLKKIVPLQKKRTLVDGGYQESLVFSLSNPALAHSDLGPGATYFMPITLRVVDSDKDVPAVKVLSTAVRATGTKLRGGLLLIPTKEVPTLENINIRDGSVHPLVFDI